MTFQPLRQSLMTSKFLCVGIMFTALLSTGCAGIVKDKRPSNDTPSKSSVVNKDDRLGAIFKAPIVSDNVFRIGDVANVQIFNDERMSRAYIVDERGDVAFPLIGQKRVVGLTALQLQDELIRSYGEQYFQNPSISVTRDTKVFGKIVVDGAVGKPGVFELANYIVMTEAIARAGGLDEEANSYDIIVLREENGRRKPYTVNYEAVRLGEQPDPIIAPSDFIYVQKLEETFGYDEILRTVPLLNLALIAATRF